MQKEARRRRDESYVGTQTGNNFHNFVGGVVTCFCLATLDIVLKNYIHVVIINLI